MIEQHTPTVPNSQKYILPLPDAAILMADPEFRKWRDDVLARAKEVEAHGDNLHHLLEEWARRDDPQEIADTHNFLMQALKENRRGDDEAA